MIDKLQHITIDDVEYPIAFTLNVMEVIQDEYGSFDAWAEILQPTKTIIDEITGEEVPAEPKVKDIIWTFKEFINEGIDIENDKKNEDRKPLTHKQVGRLVTNIREVAGMIKELTTNSVKTENPNAQTTQNLTNQQ